MNPNDTINQINKTAASITASTGTPLTPLKPVDASVPMDVSKFKTTSTTYPPAVTDTTAHNTLSSTVNGLADQLTTSQQTAATTPTDTASTTPKNTNLQDALAGILGISKKLGTQGQATLDAQNAEGVFAKQKASTDLENQIISKTRAYDKLIEQRRANTNGSFGGAVEQDIANLERQKNSELADLAIQYKVANDDYQGAVAIAKQKVDAEFQPLKDQLTTLQTYYQLSQNDMTESEKLQAQAVIQQKQDAIDFEQQKQLADYTEKIKQSDPLYQAQVADTYSSIAARNAANSPVQPGDNPQLYTGLKSATATAVRQQANNFKAEPVVQNFAVVQEGRNFAGSLSNKTKNPVDDQGLIYALAKALDPGSVVREGEYATAQRYSQSWIAAYGKGVTQALNGTGFLTEKARTQIKDTIESKYKASKTSYDNLHSQYAGSIDNLTGRDDGTKFLRDYAIQQNSDTGGGNDPLGLGI